MLRRLVGGIDDVAHERQQRWKRHTHRIGAPVLLRLFAVGERSSLPDKIEEPPRALVAINKAP